MSVAVRRDYTIFKIDLEKFEAEKFKEFFGATEAEVRMSNWKFNKFASRNDRNMTFVYREGLCGPRELIIPIADAS